MANITIAGLIATMQSSFRINKATLQAGGLTLARVATLPDKDGTLAMLSDLAGGQTENFNWKFDTVTGAGDPGLGQFRVDNAALASVTQIYFDSLCDVSGLDISNIFGNISGNYNIYLQQTDDATKYALFSTTGTYTNNTGWWTVPVTYLQSGAGGLFGISKRCTAYIINKNGAAGTPTIYTGTAVLDFGVHPGSNIASVAVTGQTAILTSTKVMLDVNNDDTTAEHTANDHAYLPMLAQFSSNTPSAGTGFTITATSLHKLSGTFKVRWHWL